MEGNVEDIVMKLKYVGEHWDYRLVAIASIIRSRRGVLNLGSGQVVGLDQSKMAKRLANQRIIEEYFVQVGLEGWEIVGQISTESLPYNGMLLIKKRIPITEDKEPEISTAIPDFKEELKTGKYRKFEAETGKNAVWNGKETKAYKDWVEEKK